MGGRALFGLFGDDKNLATEKIFCYRLITRIIDYWMKVRYCVLRYTGINCLKFLNRIYFKIGLKMNKIISFLGLKCRKMMN